MEIERAQWKGFENSLRQNETIGNDDRHVRAMAVRGVCRFRRAQRCRREQREGETARLAFDRTRRQIKAASSSRLRRTRINRPDLVAATDKLNQSRNGEVRGPHEHNAQRHVTSLVATGISIRHK